MNPIELLREILEAQRELVHGGREQTAAVRQLCERFTAELTNVATVLTALQEEVAALRDAQAPRLH